MKYIKYTFVVLAIIAFLYACGPTIPIYASHIKKTTAECKTIYEVEKLLTTAVIKPNRCLWLHGENFIKSENGAPTCVIPNAFLEQTGEPTERSVYVMYYGPGFLKSTFTVYFSETGDVLEVSEMTRSD